MPDLIGHLIVIPGLTQNPFPFAFSAGSGRAGAVQARKCLSVPTLPDPTFPKRKLPPGAEKASSAPGDAILCLPGAKQGSGAPGFPTRAFRSPGAAVPLRSRSPGQGRASAKRSPIAEQGQLPSRRLLRPSRPPARGPNSGTELVLKLLQNRKFVILGQNLHVFCYGLGDARSEPGLTRGSGMTGRRFRVKPGMTRRRAREEEMPDQVGHDERRGTSEGR